jgi:hypothetical protein
VTSANAPHLTPSSAWTWSGMAAVRASNLAEVTCYLTRPAADCFALIYYADAPEGPYVVITTQDHSGPPGRPPRPATATNADTLRCS